MSPVDLSIWPTETLQTALHFQLEYDPAAFVADCRQACGGRSRCGGVCKDCLVAELARRGVKTEAKA